MLATVMATFFIGHLIFARTRKSSGVGFKAFVEAGCHFGASRLSKFVREAVNAFNSPLSFFRPPVFGFWVPEIDEICHLAASGCWLLAAGERQSVRAKVEVALAVGNGTTCD